MRNFFLIFFCGMFFNVYAENVRLVSVSGSAEKKFKANIANLGITLWGKGKTSKEAQQNGMMAYSVFEEAVLKKKINKDSIKTTWFDLSPENTYDNKTNKYITNGYSSSQTLTLEIEDVESVGELIDFLTDLPKIKSKNEILGINIHSPRFDLKNRTLEENNLKVEAIKNAAKEARILADAAGVKIESVYRIVPVANQGMQYYDSAPMMAQKSLGESMPSKLNAGTVTIEARVNIDYLIK